MKSISESNHHCNFCGIIKGNIDVFANNDFLNPHFNVPYETENVVAFPDGAPLTPGHTLIVPRAHSLSFARMDIQTQHDLLENIHNIKLGLEQWYPNAKPYYFEHGSCKEDERIGCSTTHAHFHILFASDRLFRNWDSQDNFNIFSNLLHIWEEMDKSDYYLLGDFQGLVYGHKIREHSSLKCRMYLRKLFANLCGVPSLADYQRYTGEEATRDSLVKNPKEVMQALRDIDQGDLRRVSQDGVLNQREKQRVRSSTKR